MVNDPDIDEQVGVPEWSKYEDYTFGSCSLCGASFYFGTVSVVVCPKCGQRYITDYEEHPDAGWFCMLTKEGEE